MRSSEPTKASGAMMVQEKAGYFRMRSARLFGAASLLLSLAFAGGLEVVSADVSLSRRLKRKGYFAHHSNVCREVPVSGKAITTFLVLATLGCVLACPTSPPNYPSKPIE